MPPDFPSFLYEHLISISGVYSNLAREEECMRDSAQIKSVQLYNIFSIRFQTSPGDNLEGVGTDSVCAVWKIKRHN